MYQNIIIKLLLQKYPRLFWQYFPCVCCCCCTQHNCKHNIYSQLRSVYIHFDATWLFQQNQCITADNLQTIKCDVNVAFTLHYEVDITSNGVPSKINVNDAEISWLINSACAIRLNKIHNIWKRNKMTNKTTIKQRQNPLISLIWNQLYILNKGIDKNHSKICIY